jgi:hypothetical protein
MLATAQMLALVLLPEGRRRNLSLLRKAVRRDRHTKVKMRDQKSTVPPSGLDVEVRDTKFKTIPLMPLMPLDTHDRAMK